VQLPAAPLTAGAAAERPRLFLSYGRRDAQDLADRLAVDLAANGFAVWQDTREIATGSSWQHEIVDGLRSAQVVVALMTPHSVGTTGSADNVDSICLGEISYALFNPPPRPVVPVMAQSCEPPLAIFHLDYVDLRAWSDSPDQYQAGFRRLLAGIQAALRGEKRYRRWHHQLDPFDFAAFLHGKRRDFTGRQWLFDRIDAWRAACQRERALLITGDPGTGKSAIVAELVHRNPGGQVLAYHCCQWDVADTLKASRFVRSIAAMIVGKLEGYAALMEDPTVQEALSQSQCEADPGSALERGILTRLEHLHAPEDGPRYLLIDALDESLLAPPGSLTIVDLLASRLDRLPAWLKIVATTRKEAPVLDRLAGLRAETLAAQSPENLADVRQFLEARLSSPNLAEKLVESRLTASVVTEALCVKSSGNFLYVEQALRGLENGVYQLTQLDALPPGLGGLYTLRFERQFPDGAAFGSAKRLLDVVVAAREPLMEPQLAAATELDLEEELPVVLEQLSSYVPARLDAEGQPRYAIYHKSLDDWLTDRSRRGKLHSASAKRGHERLAAACWSEYRGGAQQMSGYALRHLATHLLVTERWDDLESLLTDLSYLEAKTVAGRVFDLAGDFSGAVAALPSERPQHRILRLLEEALRRDIHFIARHAQDYPQGLFQCLWNSGWWYDCPEAARHYVDGRPPSSPHTPTKMGLAPITDDRCQSHFGGSGRTPIMMSPCADDGTRTVPATLKVGSLRERKHPATEWPDYTLLCTNSLSGGARPRNEPIRASPGCGPSGHLRCTWARHNWPSCAATKMWCPARTFALTGSESSAGRRIRPCECGTPAAARNWLSCPGTEGWSVAWRFLLTGSGSSAALAKVQVTTPCGSGTPATARSWPSCAGTKTPCGAWPFPQTGSGSPAGRGTRPYGYGTPAAVRSWPSCSGTKTRSIAWRFPLTGSGSPAGRGTRPYGYGTSAAVRNWPSCAGTNMGSIAWRFSLTASGSSACLTLPCGCGTPIAARNWPSCGTKAP
jgi:hypothetical protein